MKRSTQNFMANILLRGFPGVPSPASALMQKVGAQALMSRCVLLALVATAVGAFAASVAVTTLIGTGTPGFAESNVNNPYGLVIGPDGALYFCDLDNQRIRRFDLKT